jgi:hypothetical protein
MHTRGRWGSSVVSGKVPKSYRVPQTVAQADVLMMDPENHSDT